MRSEDIEKKEKIGKVFIILLSLLRGILRAYYNVNIFNTTYTFVVFYRLSSLALWLFAFFCIGLYAWSLKVIMDQARNYKTQSPKILYW
jgi:hypothetical protein